MIRGLDPAGALTAASARPPSSVSKPIWGNARPQNAKGHILGHVKDLGRSAADPTARLYQTHEQQTFCTDSCDVVALMCPAPRQEGRPLRSPVSSVTLYNEMRAVRPDLALCLFGPMETDRRGEQGPGEDPFFTIPVFNWFEGHFAAIYQRQYVDSARRFAGVAPLTARQIEALDLLDTLANDPRLGLEIDFRPGDIQLVNNHVLFHDRTAFQKTGPNRSDAAICCGYGWPRRRRSRFPEVFSQRFGGTSKVGERGSITVPRELFWHAPLSMPE